MDKATIEAVIRDCGYSPRFRDYVSPRGNGVSRTFVYAIGAKQGRALGNLEIVEKLSESELRQHIRAKFAQSIAQSVR